MTTAFEDLPPAEPIPLGDGRNEWRAYFLATKPDGMVQQGKVWARVDEDKASDIRLKQEQRGNLLCGMLVDACGVVYGISTVYVGGEPEITDDVAAQSQIDVARARLIDLASAWRRAGLQMETKHFDTAHAVIYANCAQELDEVVVELLCSGEDMDLDFDDVDDGHDG